MKKILALLLAFVLLATFMLGCGGETESTGPVTVRIAGLKGPTTMGLVKIFEAAKEGTAKLSPIEITSKTETIFLKILITALLLNT